MKMKRLSREYAASLSVPDLYYRMLRH